MFMRKKLLDKVKAPIHLLERVSLCVAFKRFPFDCCWFCGTHSSLYLMENSADSQNNLKKPYFKNICSVL